MNMHLKNNSEISEQDKKFLDSETAKFEEILRIASFKNIQAFGEDILLFIADLTSGIKLIFYTVNEDIQKVVATSTFGCDINQLIKSSWNIGEGVIGQAVKSNRLAYYKDLKLKFDTSTGAEMVGSCLILPLSYNEQVSGVIECTFPNELTDVELFFLKLISKNIASMLQNMIAKVRTERLLQESLLNAERLKAQEEELRQNMEELQATQEEIQRKEAELSSQIAAINSTMATVEFTKDGMITSANSIFLEAIGYTFDEIRGKHHRVLVEAREAETPEYQSFWQNLRKGNSKVGEFLRISKDQRKVWLHSSYFPVLNTKGEIDKIIKLANVLTDTKKRDFLNQTKLEAINQSLCVLEYSPAGEIKKISPPYLKLLGYEESELIGKPINVLLDSTTEEELKHTLRRIKLGQTVQQLHHRTGKNDVEYTLNGLSVPIFDMDNYLVSIIEYLYDVTEEQKLAKQVQEQVEVLSSNEEEIRQNMEEMAITQEQLIEISSRLESQMVAINKSLGLAETDLNGRITFINPTLLDWLEIKETSISNIYELLGIQDTELVKTIEQQKTDSFELKLNTSSGKEHYCLVNASTILDINKIGIGYIFLFQEITEQKKSTLQAEKQRKQHQATLDGCLDAVVVINEKAIIQYVNPSALSLWGYDLSEMLGQRVNKLMPKIHSDKHDGYMKNYTDTHQAKIIGKGREVPILTKEGKEIKTHLTVTEANVDGDIIYTAFIRKL